MSTKYYHIECGVTDSEGRELPWDDDPPPEGSYQDDYGVMCCGTCGRPLDQCVCSNNPDPQPLLQMEHGGNVKCGRCGSLFCGERTRCPFCGGAG
jgi:hypothetical protein